MKQFIVSTLPGAVMSVDISDAGRSARSVPSHQFSTWNEWESYFLDLGAPQDRLNAVADAVKQTGSGNLQF